MSDRANCDRLERVTSDILRTCPRCGDLSSPGADYCENMLCRARLVLDSPTYRRRDGLRALEPALTEADRVEAEVYPTAREVERERYATARTRRRARAGEGGAP